MERALYYRASDGTWWEAPPRASSRRLRSRRRKGEGLLYILEPGECWELLDDGRVMVVHPGRPLKVVYPDGLVEEIAASETVGP